MNARGAGALALGGATLGGVATAKKRAAKTSPPEQMSGREHAARMVRMASYRLEGDEPIVDTFNRRASRVLLALREALVRGDGAALTKLDAWARDYLDEARARRTPTRREAIERLTRRARSLLDAESVPFHTSIALAPDWSERTRAVKIACAMVFEWQVIDPRFSMDRDLYGIVADLVRALDDKEPTEPKALVRLTLRAFGVPAADIKRALDFRRKREARSRARPTADKP